MRIRKKRESLKMSNGVLVRNLEELRQNFNLELILKYFNEGRLLKWLEDWHYDAEAEKIFKLDKNQSNGRAICEIFGVEYLGETPQEIEWRKERLNRLKEYTLDREISAKIDNVAFDVEDLLDILEEGNIRDIYLCGEEFYFPSGILKFKNKNYHGVDNYNGVGKVHVKFDCTDPIDFDTIRVMFENVYLNGEYIPPAMQTALCETKPRSEDDKPDELQHLINDANNGNVESMFNLARMYEFGEGAGKDVSKAVQWYNRAAKLSHVKAMVSLADIYLNGKGNVEKNIENAITWYTKAANAGNAFSMYALGKIYLQNNTDPFSNLSKSGKWLRKAVENNAYFEEEDINAMVVLALAFKDGIGGAENPELAFQWMQKAAENGNITATAEVGVMYLYGYGTKTDYIKAYDRIKKAVDAGDNSAMKYMGDYYLKRENNHDKAGEWYKKAANNGNKEAQRILTDWELKNNNDNESSESDDNDGILLNGNTAETTVVIKNKTGMHARPASLFVKTAWKFKSKISVKADGNTVDAKSILMLMSMRLTCGTEITISAQGSDATDAVKALKELIDKKFWEFDEDDDSPAVAIQKNVPDKSSVVVKKDFAETTVVVKNKTGIHARPASVFVQTACKFKSRISVKAKGKTVDAKSILMLMSMGLTCGTEITISAQGSDATDAVTVLKKLIDDKFGED